MELLITTEGFLSKIPSKPGVYRFYSRDETKGNENFHGEILYVGKALDLSKRVKSYFQKTIKLSPRISLMVNKIYRIEITITEDEASALLLENNLIKTLKPKYNIIFRDDKSYPLIRISKHEFPRIDSYRGKNNGDNYFGPYPNAYVVHYTIDTIQNLFKLRTCSDNFFSHRSRPCMLYQIKRCTGPCVGYVTKTEYANQVNQAIRFIKGNYTEIINDLNKQMDEAVELLNFELAANIRDKLILLKQISKEQIISNYNHPINADIILAKAINSKVFIYLINLRYGIYSGDQHYVLPNPDEDLEEVVKIFLENHYLKANGVESIYVDINFDKEFLRIFNMATKIAIISNFSKQIKRLYNMGLVNLDKVIESNLETNNGDFLESINRLSEVIGVPSGISRIECIDISHTGGANTMASLVVYEERKIDNSKYRRYNLPKEVGGDDLLGIELMLERRLRASDIPLPQLIIIDGGYNQFRLVKNIINQHGLYDKIRVLSIYKGEKRDPKYDRIIIDEQKVLGYEDEPLIFKVVQALRDEAHRFAITGHRKKQIKSMSISRINDIPNIGDAKKRALIAHFGSIKGIIDANINQLKEVSGIGAKLAETIYYHLH